MLRQCCGLKIVEAVHGALNDALKLPVYSHLRRRWGTIFTSHNLGKGKGPPS